MFTYTYHGREKQEQKQDKVIYLDRLKDEKKDQGQNPFERDISNISEVWSTRNPTYNSQTPKRTTPNSDTSRSHQCFKSHQDSHEYNSKLLNTTTTTATPFSPFFGSHDLEYI